MTTFRIVVVFIFASAAHSHKTADMLDAAFADVHQWPAPQSHETTDMFDAAFADADECTPHGGDAANECSVQLLQRIAQKHDLLKPKPTTSAYVRPAYNSDLPISKFVPQDHCSNPPCSGQVHIQLGGVGEMVVSFASLVGVEAKPRVTFAKVVNDNQLTVYGETQSYSQLMSFNFRGLFEPSVKGGVTLSREEVAKIQSTSSWAVHKDGSPVSHLYHNVTADTVIKGLGSNKNPAAFYNSPMIHTVTLHGLEQGIEYKYKVDNNDRWFYFKMPRDVAYPYQVGLTSDIGQTIVSNSTMHLLADMRPEVVLLAGDLSYADGYTPRWDSFGIMFEPLGSTVPVMTCPGNHEVTHAEQYESYNVRYPMPYRSSASTNPNYWSRDIGPMHVVSMDSYAATGHDSAMYGWLKEDLMSFSRVKTPWLVVMFHAPWYNSNVGHSHEAMLMCESMEDLFHKHGVNLVVDGHVHSYERTHPVYKNKTDTCGVVYLNLGDGGNREGPNSKWLPGEHGEDAPAWTAFRQGSFGVGSMKIMNASHASFRWERNACFDNGKTDFDFEHCVSQSPTANALDPADHAWIVRSMSCDNQK